MINIEEIKILMKLWNEGTLESNDLAYAIDAMVDEPFPAKEDGNNKTRCVVSVNRDEDGEFKNYVYFEAFPKENDADG